MKIKSKTQLSYRRRFDNDAINKITQRLWDESDSNFTSEEIRRLEIALSRLEYIAFLSNRGRLNIQFLPLELQCQIINTASTLEEPLKEGTPHYDMKEMTAFLKKRRSPDRCTP